MARWKRSQTLSRKQKGNLFIGFYIFHGIEILAILFLLGNYFAPLFFVGVGFSFHLFVDLIHEYYDSGVLDKSSLILNYCKFRKLKRQTIF